METESLMPSSQNDQNNINDQNNDDNEKIIIKEKIVEIDGKKYKFTIKKPKDSLPETLPETKKREKISKKPKKRRVVFFNKEKEAPSIIEKKYIDYLEDIARKRNCHLVKYKGKFYLSEGDLNKPAQGLLDEENLLGMCKINSWEMIPVPASLTDKRIMNKAKKELFEFVENHQPSEKRDKRTLKTIKKLILLNLEPISQKYKIPRPYVKIFTAGNSPLDHNYGIDGWVEISWEGEKERITFDLKTGNSDQRISEHADIKFKVDPTQDETKIGSDELDEKDIEKRSDLNTFTEKVSQVFEEKLKEKL